MEDVMPDPFDTENVLADLEQALHALGEVELPIPTAFFDELEALTTVPTTNDAMPFFGIRG
jgi:hypothetical protein